MTTQIWNSDHILHIAGETEVPANPASEAVKWRKRIEPWLSSVFQSEHLSLLLGNGFTTAIANHAGASAVQMGPVTFGCPGENKVKEQAKRVAEATGRGDQNLEDELSAALSLLSGLQILGHEDAPKWETAIDRVLGKFIRDILGTERGIRDGLERAPSAEHARAREVLVSFLMSFASRAASRERLQIFTINYDRLIERGADLAGLRILDRFVGAVEPEFRSSRLKIDMHYLPPGIRGEPRQLEGVVHLTKLHGSLDWRYERPRLFRTPLPFGADDTHPGLPAKPQDSLVIYPNAVKDVETSAYPYADLFRDFSAALCQPNSVLVTYGYGYGDDHVNRIIADMVTIPSTHLVVIAWGDKPHKKIGTFLERVGRPQQISLLVGKHFGDIGQLVAHYLPKPAIDPLTMRMAELVERRGLGASKKEEETEPNDDDHS